MIDFLNLQQVNRQHRAEISEAMSRVLDSGWYIRGQECERFEHNYASYIGSKWCVGVGNGLDALSLIYRAYIEMGIMAPGDEVIVPANTYIASILAITENQLVPVLVEPRFDTLEIDEELIEKAITPRTRSVMIVHLYGRCAYTKTIGKLCKEYGLKLVEDNAQAHGCRFVETEKATEKATEEASIFPRTGSIGDAAGHSFYPGKNMGALGDGGAVTTNDEQLAETIRSISNYGSHEKYVFQYRGVNSRLDELQAAILDVKLRYLDEDNKHR
ncbi:MAG: aminotransferase class V-fold PLP-dependent enzyme, partial [Prevotella sp.]|nr:aminotransferase class V-fold PLP-dependent enzyme [Prevotella sp.]